MIITYHNIAEHSAFGTVSALAFSRQMDFLKQHYEVVSFSAYIDYIQNNGHNHPKQVTVTFDDAYTSYGLLGLPVMKKLEIPSILFVCTGYLGGVNQWDRPDYQYSISDDVTIRRLALEPLVSIGAHTVTHRSLSHLPANELQHELREAKSYLEQLIGKKVEYLAYPYGQHHLNVNKKVQEEVAQAGYTAACSTNFSSYNTSDNLFALNRIDITPSDNEQSFTAKLKPKSFNFYKQKVKNIYSFLKA